MGERCCCPSDDAATCVRRRYPGTSYEDSVEEPCGCGCHYEDDDHEDDTDEEG